MQERRAIGLMSGTSCDGLDLVCASFERAERGWNFELVASEHLPYPTLLKAELQTLHLESPVEILNMHVRLGRLFSEATGDFIQKNRLEVEMICSHGHTVFHQPQAGFTLQIADPRIISRSTELPVYGDFRSQDIAFGGQGAPLVPIGDRLLFSDYDACLNLGGFANISFESNGRRMAYDICAVNTVLNELCQRLGVDFDEGGKLSAVGEVDEALLDQLNAREYFQQEPPKTLGREWLDEEIRPLVFDGDTKNLLRTFTEHVAIQLGRNLKLCGAKSVLVTGGGAKNEFLMERIQHHFGRTIEGTTSELIDFKEALIFAFLGVLKQEGEINVLASVTGASRDHSSGQLYDLR